MKDFEDLDPILDDGLPPEAMDEKLTAELVAIRRRRRELAENAATQSGDRLLWIYDSPADWRSFVSKNPHRIETSEVAHYLYWGAATLGNCLLAVLSLATIPILSPNFLLASTDRILFFAMTSSMALVAASIFGWFARQTFSELSKIRSMPAVDHFADAVAFENQNACLFGLGVKRLYLSRNGTIRSIDLSEVSGVYYDLVPGGRCRLVVSTSEGALAFPAPKLLHRGSPDLTSDPVQAVSVAKIARQRIQWETPEV